LTEPAFTAFTLAQAGHQVDPILFVWFWFATVVGQIKGVRGFRRFLLRGLAKVRGEWRLVCLTHNLLKIWRYGCAAAGN
jgi:hypothetical protein